MNLSEEALDFDRLVEAYRSSLFINAYKEGYPLLAIYGYVDSKFQFIKGDQVLSDCCKKVYIVSKKDQLMKFKNYILIHVLN